MNEQHYQTRIIKKIKDDGGWAVNGNFTLAGEPDLQCGIPITLVIGDPLTIDDGVSSMEEKTILIYCAVEVKDEFNYHRVMRGIDKFYNIVDKKKLKQHEALQMAKIREIRSRGGLALVAWNYKQIKDYINEEI